MKVLYDRSLLSVSSATVILLFLLHQPAFGQPAVREGVIRIKVTEALATQLESRKFSKTLSGEVLTGVESLDKKNRQFKVKQFSRVFRPAGKNEARHRKYGLHLWYEVSMNRGNAVSEAVRSYKADKQVLESEPVYMKTINGSANESLIPLIVTKRAHAESVILPSGANDPQLASQWHYQNRGQTGGTHGADIKLFDAWKLETGNKKVVVALTDGGIQSDHEDLKANMWVNSGEIAGNKVDDDRNGYVDDIHGYSFVDNSGVIEPHYHGTHVAGTIASVSNNGRGIAGIAGGAGSGDGVRLMSCAVYSNSTSGGHAESYIYAADNGAVISQNSWGYINPGVYEQAVLAAIDYFIAEAGKDEHGNQVGPMKGGIVIFAAGNNNSEGQYYPGYYAPTFSVASTNHKDEKAYYSNFGSWVDIAAPGGETNSQSQQGVLSTLPGNQYGYLQGTSMAAPHVSGVAALIVSSYSSPGFTPAMLKERMQQTADKLSTGYPGKLGAGRVNAFAALENVSDGQQICSATGDILREQWNGISGTMIPSIPLDKEPSQKQILTLFESPSNIGDNYGTRIRGFLCVPEDGPYTFWIASNDKSELYLSTDDTETNKVRIAHVAGYTNIREWTKYPTQQQSDPTYLVAGKRYYIEALHKEGTGSDHLAVGWQLPDGTLERPIPGKRLSPFKAIANIPPVVKITSPGTGSAFPSPATVHISATASDPDGTVTRVEFHNGDVKLADDLSAPYTFTWNGVPSGQYQLTAIAIDNAGMSTTTAPVQFSVESVCGAGAITREYWMTVSGSKVSDIPVTRSPDGSEALQLFEGPTNAGTNYASRISGYICPPVSGNYYFWISSNDHAELWLSSSQDPDRKQKIAFVSGATAVREWEKFGSQKSVAIPLTAGRSYFIEALHKQGIGSDHIAVGWQLPDGTLERPIQGRRLSPSDGSPSSMAEASLASAIETSSVPSADLTMQFYPNPVEGKWLTVSVENSVAESSTKLIEIRQLTGLPVYSEKITCNVNCSSEVNIEGFPPGLYILQVKVQGRTFTERLQIP